MALVLKRPVELLGGDEALLGVKRGADHGLLGSAPSLLGFLSHHFFVPPTVLRRWFSQAYARALIYSGINEKRYH